MPTKTCTHHCGACGLHFSSLEAFDLHRTGDYGQPTGTLEGRHCEHPIDVLDRNGEMRLAPTTEQGICRMYARVRAPVTIWGSRRLVGRAEGAFGRRRAAPSSQRVV